MATNIQRASTVILPAAKLAIVFAFLTVAILAGLHLLSLEFDPSWRVVSEYANGSYGWVLSLMFAAWALSSWALAFALKPLLTTKAGKVGLVFLVASGIGEAMAAMFDVNHPLHELASFVGVGGLPVAALLISTRLAKTQAWAKAKKTLLLTANATWVSVVLMFASLGLMIGTFVASGAEIPADSTAISAPPEGVIALVGWFNRLLIVVYCAWIATVSWLGIKLSR